MQAGFKGSCLCSLQTGWHSLQLGDGDCCDMNNPMRGVSPAPGSRDHSGHTQAGRGTPGFKCLEHKHQQLQGWVLPATNDRPEGTQGRVLGLLTQIPARRPPEGHP